MAYENAVAQLVALFPGIANAMAWKDAIYRAQSGYPDKPPGPGLVLSIAQRWIELANASCLEAKSDPVNGLVVREVPRNTESVDITIVRKYIAKLLFNKLNNLADHRLLQVFELMPAFKAATGKLLQDHSADLEAVVAELQAKHYLVLHRTGNSGMHLFAKGIDFDKWVREMKGNSRMATGDTFNFHGTVGAVQTGANSVANVQQAVGLEQFLELKNALHAMRAELDKVNISAEDHENAQALIESTIAEADKPKPNRFTTQTLLGGLTTVTGLISATSDAYKATREALKPFGIDLP